MARPRKSQEPQQTEMKSDQTIKEDHDKAVAMSNLTERVDKLDNAASQSSDVFRKLNHENEPAGPGPIDLIIKLEANKIIDKREERKIGEELKSDLVANDDKLTSTILKEESPCAKYARDSCGLIKGLDYKFKSDNTVDWRAMVGKEYLVPNRSNFERRNQPVPNSIDGLEDRDLMILLAGIKEIASIRGFHSVNYDVVVATPEYVCVKCTVQWNKNYESNSVTFSALADASISNTKSFARNYLATIAENRAFVRTVRSFLKIHIVGQDEIGDVPNEESAPSINDTIKKNGPHEVLNKRMTQRNISFGKLKETCIKNNMEGADSWTDIYQIKRDQIEDILKRMAEKEQKAADPTKDV